MKGVDEYGFMSGICGRSFEKFRKEEEK